MNKRVFFATPPYATGTTSDLAYNSIADVILTAGAMGYGRIGVPNLRVDIARHRVQQKFMELTFKPDDTLIFLDLDHSHPVTILEQLVNDDKPVVASLSFKRGEPYCPCAYKKDPFGKLHPLRQYSRGLIRVDATGFPAVAIKRSVFTTLQEQGFTRYPNFCYEYPEDNSFPSEDFFFSAICERAGIPIFVDTRIVCPHLTINQVNESSWEQWCKEHTPSGGKVSVIIAVEGNNLEKCVANLLETAPQVEVIALGQIGATSLPAQVKRVLLSKNRTKEQMWNLGVKMSQGDMILPITDNTEFQAGWLESSLESAWELPEGRGGISFGEHIMVSKELWGQSVSIVKGSGVKAG